MASAQYIIEVGKDGKWLQAHGYAFPEPIHAQFTIPLWAHFLDDETGDEYEWNGGAWVALSGGGGPHGPTHEDGGGDEVDVTLLAGFPGGTANFLRADGTFAAPTAAAAPDQDARVLAFLMGGY